MEESYADIDAMAFLIQWQEMKYEVVMTPCFPLGDCLGMLLKPHIKIIKTGVLMLIIQVG